MLKRLLTKRGQRDASKSKVRKAEAAINEELATVVDNNGHAKHVDDFGDNTSKSDWIAGRSAFRKIQYFFSLRKLVVKAFSKGEKS